MSRVIQVSLIFFYKVSSIGRNNIKRSPFAGVRRLFAVFYVCFIDKCVRVVGVW